MAEVAAVLVRWEAVLGRLLDRTAGFPKAVCFTFGQRMALLALEVLEAVIEARFAAGPSRQAPLRRADLALAKLRVLAGPSFERGWLDGRTMEALANRRRPSDANDNAGFRLQLRSRPDAGASRSAGKRHLRTMAPS